MNLDFRGVTVIPVFAIAGKHQRGNSKENPVIGGRRDTGCFMQHIMGRERGKVTVASIDST